MATTLEFEVEAGDVEITGSRGGLNVLAQTILDYLRRPHPQSSNVTLFVRHYSSPGPHRVSIFLDEDE